MLLTAGKTPDQTKEQVIGFCPALQKVVWMRPVIRHYCTIVPFHFHFNFHFHFHFQDVYMHFFQPGFNPHPEVDYWFAIQIRVFTSNRFSLMQILNWFKQGFNLPILILEVCELFVYFGKAYE